MLRRFSSVAFELFFTHRPGVYPRMHSTGHAVISQEILFLYHLFTRVQLISSDQWKGTGRIMIF